MNGINIGIDTNVSYEGEITIILHVRDNNVPRIDVHTYDRCILYKPMHELKWCEVIDNCHKLHECIKSFNCNNNGVERCINDIDKESNNDTVNNMRVEDLLCDLYLLLSDNVELSDTICNSISEQLFDMETTGQCPAGRTLRLYSLYSAFSSKN
jgi:hypothetical protein